MAPSDPVRLVDANGDPITSFPPYPSETVLNAAGTATNQNDNPMVAADTTHQIVPVLIVVQNKGGVTVGMKLRNGTTDITPQFDLAAGGTFEYTLQPGYPLKTAVNAALNLWIASAGASFVYWVRYYLE